MRRSLCKHLIDARNQPLCATAIVFVIGSKSQAERSLFNMNAIQHSQGRWNEDNGKTGPVCVREGQKPGESVPDRDRKDDGRGYRVRFARVLCPARIATLVLKAPPSVKMATIRTPRPRIKIPRAAGRSQL